jgi:hypothetical protein
MMMRRKTIPSDGEPTISLHALIGIQPRAGRAMQIVVTINGIGLLALLDIGSTHNFINTDKAAISGQWAVPARLEPSRNRAVRT